MFNALDIVNLKNDVLSMPLGLRTVISASSSSSSGGHVQRLAIARAIIRHPELLVFDESTSSLDSINEEDLYRKLAQLNITTIIVSHKLSTIKNADKILVIDGGKIVESGTHEMLMNKKGIYYICLYTKPKSVCFPLCAFLHNRFLVREVIDGLFA